MFKLLGKIFGPALRWAAAAVKWAVKNPILGFTVGLGLYVVGEMPWAQKYPFLRGAFQWSGAILVSSSITGEALRELYRYAYPYLYLPIRYITGIEIPEPT